MWDEIADAAAAESTLWAEALLPRERQAREAVFSTFGPPTEAVGLETIYEGYLLHYGRPRLFSPPDADAALLLGDYLYAQGLGAPQAAQPRDGECGHRGKGTSAGRSCGSSRLSWTGMSAPSSHESNSIRSRKNS